MQFTPLEIWKRHAVLLCIHFTVFGCQSVDRFIFIETKIKHPIHIMVSRGGRYASIHFPSWPHTQHRGLHQMHGRGSASMDREGGC